MIREELKNNIVRTQKAYELYKRETIYLCALRIYSSNKKIYNLLEDFLKVCDSNILEDVVIYLFHLDDWFNQFEETKRKLKPGLEDIFICDALNVSVRYPKDFTTKL